MLRFLFGNTYICDLCGIVFAFVATFLSTKYGMKILPADKGRAYAHEGKLSAGKPRGAGIYFVGAFLLSSILFGSISSEMGIYLVLVFFCMLTGFLDDCSNKPWGEYKKGALDLLISILVAINYLYHHSAVLYFGLFKIGIALPPILMGFIITCIVWCSINVTNCADGVDGLSGTLTIISLLTCYLIDSHIPFFGMKYSVFVFIICIIAYLWFNATPSILMMGDAGSRAMGIMIAIAVLTTGSVMIYFPIAIVIILDGGLGLIKVSLLRFLKISILKNIRCPLHDHVRKNMNWSNTQCVFRFAIIQIVINIIVLYLIKIL